MKELLQQYATWLHLRWPAGLVEPLPEVRPDGSTAVTGLYIAGDLTGVPLLKFALDSGTRVARTIAADPELRRDTVADRLDLVILGAGVAGMAAAVEARSRGLRFAVIESREPFATLENFPRRKPIFTYPMDMKPEGALQVGATVKESLLEELHAQVRAQGIDVRSGRAERVQRLGDHLVVHLADGSRVEARRVLIAIGRSGDHRTLGVPGQDLDIVSNRLHDPNDHAGQDVVVVGGGDSAVEAAIALVEAGARVTFSHRGARLDRPKPENVERLTRLAGEAATAGRLRIVADSSVTEVLPTGVVLATPEGTTTCAANAVYALIGREAPLAFLRRSGVPIIGEMNPSRWLWMSVFLAFCTWMYDWKSGGVFTALWQQRRWFPVNLPDLLAAAGGAVAAAAASPATVLGTLAISATTPAFWVTLAYSAVVVGFGAARIRRRRTPYVTAQTLTLMAVQVLPLFLLPEFILPLLEHRGALPAALGDALFPRVDYGHGREFWRAYGLVLAWPLNIYNVITHEPLWWWIGIGFVQTCVLIPLGIHHFGKGFYCGWICSCGALAETLGDTHRHKMPHGPRWNRLNLAGQGILALAAVMLALRVLGWALPGADAVDRMLEPWLKTPYKWVVDVGLAGILGYGVYFWYSGRAWCRFFCPLAALMHIYARFSRFAIVPEKKKCISCNQCTTVCHMGIDVMSFANKGQPMQDPQCVRCSACVQACPTGVLQFGQVDSRGGLISLDSLAASPVRMREDRR